MFQPSKGKIKVPSYRLHKGSGQAIVQYRKKRYYLGVYGSPASQEKYRQFVAELMQAPTITPSVVDAGQSERAEITIVEVAVAYREWAKGYYLKNGEPTQTLIRVMVATKALVDLYGRLPARDFGPLKLQSFRQSLVDNKQARNYINNQVAEIKRMFRWAASQELVPVTVHQSLATVTGLKRGRTEARESKPVLPVDDLIVDATLPFLPVVVADMIRLQRLTGMRPGELFQLRPCDVDRSGDVWSYTPASHKTEHRGKERKVFIGPKAQDVLRPYLLRDAQAYCFSPIESERKRREALHAARKTPLRYGNRPGTNRVRRPKRKIHEQYNANSYNQAISRAVALANRERLKVDPQAKPLPDWHPNQLRHTAATEIRKQFGLEAAQVALGHSAANVTQTYAERDYGLAAQVAKAIG